MTVLLPLSLVVPLALGLVVCGWFMPGLWRSGWGRVAAACLSVGVGLGITSCFCFLWLALIGPTRSAYVASEVTLLAAVAGLALTGARRRPRVTNWLVAPSPSRRRTRALRLAFCSALLLALAAFVVLSTKNPYGRGDAIAIWNLKARWLYLGADAAPAGLRQLLAASIADYPLLVPTSIVRAWSWIGSATPAVPAAVALLYTFAVPPFVAAVLVLLRGEEQGLLAGFVLLANPLTTRLGASQYADVPLSLYFISAIALVCLHERLPASGRGPLILAGAVLALAGWTKNEGLLFLAAFIASNVLALCIGRRWRVAGERLLWIGAGALPILAVVAYFRLTLAPTNYLLGASASEPLSSRLLAVGRYGEIARLGLEQLTRYHGAVLLGVALVAAYIVTLGVCLDRRDIGAQASLLTFLLVAIGYVATYVATPLPLEWQLRTSLARLLLQLWPTAVFLVFLLVRSPAELVALDAVASAVRPSRQSGTAR